MITIAADRQFTSPPRWAVLERELIDLMGASVEPLLERYVRPDGTIMWPPDDSYSDIDGLDDAYESFHNWPLFYLAGGPEKMLAYSHREFDAITRQFTQYDCGHGHPMVVREYEQGYDWMHQGEGYLFFYLLNLANPGGGGSVKRAIRYAGFYTGDDPEAANYDSDLNIIRCCYSGSMGPAYRNFTGQPWGPAPWKEHYGLPFYGLSDCVTVDDIKSSAGAAAVGKAMKERMGRGDAVVNLAATSMVANAYLHTGDERYRAWVLRYLEGWIDRTRKNGGVLPDNTGPSGEVGELMGGRWYGGYYGWTWPHGFSTMASAIAAACENAALVSGDSSYLELLRSQISILVQQAVEKDGTLLVPHKHADPGAVIEYLGHPSPLTDQAVVSGRADFRSYRQKDGWFEYHVMDPRGPVHLWNASMSAGDLGCIETIRDRSKDGNNEIPSFYAKDQGGHDHQWIRWLNGEFPDYPERILEHNAQQCRTRLADMETDTEDPAAYGDAYLQKRNPVTMEGLVQLTMGGPLPMYNGGLLQVSVRYYDAVDRRPGLPPDCAALVDSIGADGFDLRLVNLSARLPRRVVVQAGGFGEHRFGSVVDRETGATYPVGGPWFVVALAPRGDSHLRITMRRRVATPSYASPFD